MNQLINQPKSCGYTVRLAKDKNEIERAQKLRYKSMILEFNPNADPNGTDACEEDNHCDHLIAVNDDTGEIVGNYRFVTKAHGIPFFCTGEFDLTNLAKNDNILEIGRAVVDPDCRNAPIIKLLWHGLFNYCKQFGIRYIFGTASYHMADFDANDIQNFKYKDSFTNLYLNHQVDKSINCTAKAPAISLKDVADVVGEFDPTEAKFQTPALIRTYLAMGGRVCDSAYIDNVCKTIDCMVITDLCNFNEFFVKKLLGDL